MFRDKLKKFYKKKISFTGIAIAFIKSNKKIDILLKDIFVGDEYISDHIHVFLNYSKAKSYVKGDIIRVTCSIKRYKKYTKVNGTEIVSYNYGIGKIFKLEKRRKR